MYDTGSSPPAGASGKVTGEGSHFGSGGAGTDSAGYSLGKSTTGQGFSAAEPEGNTDSSGYSLGKGPAVGTHEAENHMNTAAAPEALGQIDDTAGDQTGQADVRQTSTYSSHPLSTGDKTSSVVDPSSSDPTTFQKPETSVSGVGPDAAETAARKAYGASGDHMPGSFPAEDHSNPYAATSLDPRVDSPSHTGRDTALGVGAGAAGIGVYEASKTHGREPSSTATPSNLTSTTNPAGTSPAYGSTSETRGLDSATPAATATDESTPKKSGMVGSVLGALGLKHEADKDSSAVDSTPSATTGVGSHNRASQSGPPPEHHRKESIPTTAYPSGNLDSVRPIAGPTGQDPTQGSSGNYGRDAAIVGGGAGIGALGAHEYEKSKEPMAGTSSGEPTYYDSVTSGQPTGTKSGSSGLAAAAGTTGPVVPGSSTTPGDDSHLGRDALIGGGAVGAAGLGAHEYEKSRTSGVTPTSQQYGNQPISTSGTSKDFSNSVDPRTDAAGNANQGTGMTAVPATTSQQPEDSHFGRDAAIVGGGAAAAGVGAHEISEHDDKNAEKQYNKLQKSQDKEAAKEQKAHEKELKKEQKAEEKAEKKHEKALAKEEKKQEKEAAKVEKQHEKEFEKEEKRREKEGATAVGAGAVGAGGAYEYEKHEKSLEPSGGRLAAADAIDRETYSKQSDTLADPGLNRSVQQPPIAGSDTDHSYGKDAAIGGAGVTALGTGAYEAEKDHEASQVPITADTTDSNTHDTTTHGTDPYYTRHPVPDSAIEDGSTSEPPKGMSRLEAADAIDRQVYGGRDPNKPSLLKRIFKRKKNAQTGESEDDEENYEDVPNEGTTTSIDSPSSTNHGQGELVKPSYNPFKKEVASDYGAASDKI